MVYKIMKVLCFVLFLFCFVLFCFVLFCFVLFCFVLFCFVLFCFVLFCFLFLLCFVLFCFVLFCFFDILFTFWITAYCLIGYDRCNGNQLIKKPGSWFLRGYSSHAAAPFHTKVYGKFACFSVDRPLNIGLITCKLTQWKHTYKESLFPKASSWVKAWAFLW